MLDVNSTKKCYIYKIILPNGEVGEVRSDKNTLTHDTINLFRNKLIHQARLASRSIARK